jgi:type II secretory pathway predicted ATPase ExeA
MPDVYISRAGLDNAELDQKFAVGVLSRPQASLADFYRELGHLFSVPLSPNNRWASAKVLREKWLHHIDSSLYRPVLLIDESQEMTPPVFSELRLLSSADLDFRSILTTILAGDRRLANRLEGVELLSYLRHLQRQVGRSSSSALEYVLAIKFDPPFSCQFAHDLK